MIALGSSCERLAQFGIEPDGLDARGGRADRGPPATSAKDLLDVVTTSDFSQFGNQRSIVLGTVAVVLPILSQIYTDDDKAAIAPGWAGVALAAAAALIGFDRYFGFSAGWTRFMAAELHVTRLRHDFEYAWQAARAAATAPPSDEDVAARSRALASSCSRSMT